MNQLKWHHSKLDSVFVMARFILKSRRAGFSLLELSLSFVIIAVLGTGALTLFASSLDRRQIEETQGRLQTIQDALLEYRRTFDRLPCPADITLATSAANFGVEAASPGVCTGGSPAANFTAGLTGGPVAGGIPTKTLRLPDDFSSDGYGRRILYAVDTRLTYTAEADTTNYTPSFTTYPVANTVVGNITVRDAGNNDRTTKAAYVLLSFGKNGHGAYSRQGGTTRIVSGSTNSQELENCDCDASAAGTGFDEVFVQRALTDNATNKSNVFDDVLAYEIRANILSKYE